MDFNVNLNNVNLNNTNQNAPIFNPNPVNIPSNNSNNTFTDPFDKLLNKAQQNINQNPNLNNNYVTNNNELENYKRSIEKLDIEQLRQERKKLVNEIVKLMDEGRTEELDLAQKKYKIAMEVTDSKLNNFSNSLLAKTDNNTPNTQEISKEDFLKKLQESEILKPDSTPASTIPIQTTEIMSKTENINNTSTNIINANPDNPNVSIFNLNQNNPTLNIPTLSPSGMINNNITPNLNSLNNLNTPQNNLNTPLLNNLTNINSNQLNNILSNPSMFNSMMNFATTPVHPYSPLMTMYGVYAPNLRTNPTMNAFLNGELYPQDMADLGVWSALQKEYSSNDE
ncbi:MAG: hypothetical protein N2485_05855 [bacterium]|nr:hypothetical protein [bacterium]